MHRLLEALQVPCNAARLREAGEESTRVGHSCTQWLREVLIAAQVKELSPLLIPWQRFDPRRLPALLRHRGSWYYAENLPVVSDTRTASDSGAAVEDVQAVRSEGVRLMSSDGGQSLASTAELDGAEVLWLRQPRSRAPESIAALTGNLAMGLVWRELFRERGWLWQVVVATCLVNLIGISTALFAMQVYDRVVPTMAYATLTTLVAGMAIVVVVQWLLSTIRARILDSLACAVDERVSQQVFEHLLKVRLDAQPRSLGTLAAQIGGLETVRQFFSAAVVFALVDLPFALMFLAFIGIIGGAVAWVYLLLLPAALILGYVTQWRLRKFLRSQLSRINERQGVLVDPWRRIHPRQQRRLAFRPGVAGDHRQHQPFCHPAKGHRQFFHDHHEQSLHHRLCSGSGCRSLADRGGPAHDGRADRLQHSRRTNHRTRCAERAASGAVAACAPGA